MKTKIDEIKELVDFDEYDQDKIDKQLWDIENRVLKELYYNKLDSLINKLQVEYKKLFPKIQFKFVIEASGGLEKKEQNELIENKIPFEGISTGEGLGSISLSTAYLPVKKGYLKGWNTAFNVFKVIGKCYISKDVVAEITKQDYLSLYPASFEINEIEKLMIYVIEEYNRIKYENNDRIL